MTFSLSGRVFVNNAGSSYSVPRMLQLEGTVLRCRVLRVCHVHRGLQHVETGKIAVSADAADIDPSLSRAGLGHERGHCILRRMARQRRFTTLALTGLPTAVRSNHP